MKKVVVTGGSGRLGQLVIHELLSHDYQVLSLDRLRPAVNLCPSWIADLRSSGDLYEALLGAWGVVHLGAYQAPGLAPDAEVFSNNVTATYNVLKAASDLGVKKAVIASSTAAFGFIYALTRILPEYLPLDEKHPSRPQDPYGLSKLVGEQIADSLALLHDDMTISSLRFPGVTFDPSYDSVRERWKDPGARAKTSWAYIDARDAAIACRLAIEAEFNGHQVMIVAAPTSSMRESTAELIGQYLDRAIELKTARTDNWSGVNSAKAEKILGFKAQYGWEKGFNHLVRPHLRYQLCSLRPRVIAPKGSPMSYYKSLSEYVQALERAGLLFRVTRPINKDTEMHPLVRWQFRGLDEEQRRAFLFENIFDAKGKKYDIPVLIGGLAASQRIYALGLMCKESEVEEIWSQALEKPIEPVLVKEGAVQEVVYQGEELVRSGGLYKLPIPISTPGFDNAPYLTAGCWITKDPETGVRNMGVYRGQIKGPLKTGIMWGSLKHTAIHWEKCNERGIPLDAAIVLGGPPCITYAAVQPVPYGVDEVALAGGLARSPLEMVRCKTVNLEVPAQADIVIEGKIPSDYLEPDGPFGEAHGYLDPGDLNGVFEVTCITHRKNPIYVSMISQLTPSESSKIKQSAYETLALNHLIKNVGVNARRVALYEDLLNRQVAVIQIKKEKPDDTWRALEGLLPSRVIHKVIVCVDEDIDPHDAQSLLWAMANRCQPHRDMRIVPNRPLPWNPIRYVADGEHYDVTDSTLLVDATLKASFPPVALPKRPYMERAREIWQELGLPTLTPRPPWSGYSLGLWPEEAAIQAENAVAGNHNLNAEFSSKQGIKVPKGAKFMDLKKKYMADEIEKFKKQAGAKK